MSETIPYTPVKWKDDGTFHLGINMAGAVSAGAYTAGALDFLMEAIEQWYTAQKTDPTVPQHKLSIDVFSGASAGGMCAAIAAVMVQGSFEHIWNADDPKVQGTTNRFYESWVNMIGINPLLEQRDLGHDKPIVSLLDCTVIDEIAAYAINPGPANPPPYISPSLNLFLSLSNVRTIPYVLDSASASRTDDINSDEERVAFYADRLQFETVRGESRPLSPRAKPLPVGQPGAGAWPLLQEAAKATGAVPIALAPRKLPRDREDYMHSPWLPLTALNPPPSPPAWGVGDETNIDLLYVDGGMTDNDPFELAHDYLAIHNPDALPDPETGQLRNRKEPERANCAVLTIAPFPATCEFEEKFDFKKNSGIAGMLPNLITVLISQSRFLGESLTSVMGGTSSSRFVLAPSDTGRPSKKALQCGLVGAFGGFFERGFRAHDYQLGRRNCQRFLQEHFAVAHENPIIKMGLKEMTEEQRNAAVATHGFIAADGIAMMRIIPLCGSAVGQVTESKRATITNERLEDILEKIGNRLNALVGPLVDSLDDVPSGLERTILKEAARSLVHHFGMKKIEEVLRKELKHDLAQP